MIVPALGAPTDDTGVILGKRFRGLTVVTHDTGLDERMQCGFVLAHRVEQSRRQHAFGRTVAQRPIEIRL